MLRRDPDALWTEFEQQIAVLCVGTGRYFEVQGVGIELWRQLEHPCEASSLVGFVVSSYRIDEARATADVEQFLTELRQAGLLLESSASAAPGPG